MTGAAEARLERSDGRFELVGELTFETVTGLWQAAADELARADWPVLDLARIRRTDSAGLALLVDWARRADGDGRSLQLDEAPAQLKALANASGVQELLGLTD